MPAASLPIAAFLNSALTAFMAIGHLISLGRLGGTFVHGPRSLPFNPAESK